MIPRLFALLSVAAIVLAVRFGAFEAPALAAPPAQQPTLSPTPRGYPGPTTQQPTATATTAGPTATATTAAVVTATGTAVTATPTVTATAVTTATVPATATRPPAPTNTVAPPPPTATVPGLPPTPTATVPLPRTGDGSFRDDGGFPGGLGYPLVGLALVSSLAALMVARWRC